MMLKRPQVYRGLTFASILIYMLAFVDVPLFFDEAAFRRYNGRAFIDGFLQMNFFPQCDAATASAWLLRPAHLFFSWVDSWPAWAGVRSIPLVTYLLLVGSIFLVIPKTPQGNWARWLVLSGFVGLSGVGFVLFRPEFVAALQVAMCALTWWLAGKPALRWPLLTVVVVAHLGITMLSLFVHMQGLVVLPLSFVACMRLLRRQPFVAALVTVLMVLMAFQSMQQFVFRCPGDPSMEAVMAETHGVIYSRSIADLSWPERAVQRVRDYTKLFMFWNEPRYSVPVPGVPGAGRLINPLIGLTVALNLAALVAGILWVSRKLWRDYRAELSWKRLRPLLRALAVDGRALWAMAALILLFYSFYEQGGMFYRGYFRNLLTALLLAIGVAYLPPSRLVKGWVVMVVVTSLLSAIVVWSFIRPPLHKGFESYYVSLQRDWPAFDARVNKLAAKCGITADAEHVVVDVATYRALRDHPRPVDYNYVWYFDYLKTSTMPERNPREWLRYYRQYSKSGYVVLCRSLDSAPLPAQHRDGELCCHSFK